MIWIFLAVALGIITFTSLGAMSVWLVILGQAVKVLLFVVSFGLLYLVWRQFKDDKKSKQNNNGKLEDKS